MPPQHPPPQVLCLGEMLWDCLADQPSESVVAVRSWTAYPGGAPANVACALAKLGTRAGFVGCVGLDAAGAGLLDVLRTHQVDRTGVQRDAQAPTREVLVLRSQTGDRTFAGFKDHPTTAFADTQLQAHLLPEVLWQGADYLVLGTLGLASPVTGAAIEQALVWAHRHQVQLVVDMNWRPVFWPDPTVAKPLILHLLSQAQIVKFAQEEAQWLLGTADLDRIRCTLPQATAIFVTAGHQGCSYQIGAHQGHHRAFPVTAMDTTGAGDAFVAGLVHQLCRTGTEFLQTPMQTSEIVRYASAVGALTTTQPGAIAAQPTAADVESYLTAVP